MRLLKSMPPIFRMSWRGSRWIENGLNGSPGE